MPLSFTRTLRLKVRRESYGWLNAAAIEVNQVFNYCNETSCTVASRTDLKRKWLSGFDLCRLTAGATEYFERIDADTIQRICTDYVQRRLGALLGRGHRRQAARPHRKIRMLQYKGEHAGRSVQIVNERNTTRACSNCGAFTGPRGLRHLVVRQWECAHCGESHDRDVNAARNILMVGSRCRTSVRGNESSPSERPPSQTSCLREAGLDAQKAAA